VVKRKRGRPAKDTRNARKFCGIAQFRRETRKAEKKAVREAAFKDVEDFFGLEVRQTRANNPLPDKFPLEDERGDQGTEALNQRMTLDYRALLQIAKGSGNLKGTCQRGALPMR